MAIFEIGDQKAKRIINVGNKEDFNIQRTEGDIVNIINNAKKKYNICHCCGEEIQCGEETIAVSYGYASWKNGRFYNSRGVDYFHQKCDIAKRQNRGGT